MTGAPGDPGPQVTRDDRASGGVYRTILDGHSAEMTFSCAGTTLLIIDHTDVPDALRGRRVGQLLVRRAVEDAREAGLKIIPLCPFAAAQFRKNPDYADVLSR